MQLTLILCIGVFSLASGCDSLVEPDDPFDLHGNWIPPLLPLLEHNFWLVNRAAGAEHGDPHARPDSLVSLELFRSENTWWAEVVATDPLLAQASGFFTQRSDGYHHSPADPRSSSDAGTLKYAYPAKAGLGYVIESHSEGTINRGRSSVTLLATDRVVETPFGEREAHHYRFVVDTAYRLGTEYPVEGVSYDHLLVPGLGFVQIETVHLQFDPESGTFRAAGPADTWTLVDAQVFYPVP